MNKNNRRLSILLACLAFVGCAPTISYKLLAERDPMTGVLIETPREETGTRYEPKTKSIANPAKNEFIYGSGRSQIVLIASAASSQEKAKTEEANKCPNDGVQWQDCLIAISPKVTAASEPDFVYALRTGQGLFVKSVTGDSPINTKSITFNYQNPVKQGITQSAGAATAAYAFAGPVGAVLAVLFVQAEQAYQSHGIETPYIHKSDKLLKMIAMDDLRALKESDLICKETKGKLERLLNEEIPLPSLHQIYLPVTLQDPALAVSGSSSDEEQACWSIFPQGDSNHINRGWFYRVTESKVPSQSSFPPVNNKSAKEALADPFVRRRDIIKQDVDYFAVPACRSVMLELTWWDEILDKKVSDSIVSRKYPLYMADPSVMQKISLWKSERTVSLLSCGGYATESSGAIGTDALAEMLFKQAKEIHAVEQAFEKAR